MASKPLDDSYIVDVNPKSKWRFALVSFNCTRAFLSLADEIMVRKNSTAPDIELGCVNSSLVSAVQFIYSEEELRSFSEVVKNKNLTQLMDLGGVRGLAMALKTDEENGVQCEAEEISLRQAVFGVNAYVGPSAKGLLHFVYEALQDRTHTILLVCAILSMGLDIAVDGSSQRGQGQWLFITVVFSVFLSAGAKFLQFHKDPSSISTDIQVDAKRSGRRQLIPISDVVVGDIVYLKIGDHIPADGLFLKGYSMQVDESIITGEGEHVQIDDSEHIFLFSGTKVVDGCGHMLVTSVGRNTAWGDMMSTLNRDDRNQQTPLQGRLDTLTSSIRKMGFSVGVLMLIVSIVRYDNKEYSGTKTKFDDINGIVKMVADAFMLMLLVAEPEGLPLQMTVTCAYSTMKRMMAGRAMVRKLSACETMGLATTICTDKTGTLTLNQMKVTKFWLGKEAIGDGTASTIAPTVLQSLLQGVGLNTTASVYRPTAVAEPEFTGSPTEKAILSWAISDMGLDLEDLKHDCSIMQVVSFNSEQKRSGILIRKKDDKTVHVHWKGGAEMILSMCSHYYAGNGGVGLLNEQENRELKHIIQNMAAESLRCIAFAHGHIKQELDYSEEGKVPESAFQEHSLILLGIAGIEDPCHPGARKAVKACLDAGVQIKMITGDNVFTARAIAIECGILHPNVESDGEMVVEGFEFRNYSDEERMEKVDKICVMASSSPFDKLLMVQCLKKKGHVVAVTGDGTNDAPELKEADIGLSMGIQGTDQVAKQSSDIVIWDDNFASLLVTVVQCGRCVRDNVQKFIQFQLTITAVALVINFIAAVSAGEAPLTVTQLLWVNLIMDTLAALALATEKPTQELMERPPVDRTAPLITNVMWRNIIAQSIFQIAVLLTMQFKAKAIFGVNDKVKDTLIFNTYVLCQVFNEFNARSIEKRNVFKGIQKNKLFLVIVGFTIVLHGIIVELLQNIADTEGLNWRQWGACIALAAISWPLGCVVKCLPVPETPFLDLIRTI